MAVTEIFVSGDNPMERMMAKPSTAADGSTNFRRLSPLHPGEMLREEFLLPLRLPPYALAKAISLPRTRIERLVRERTAITADTALRLGRYFNMTPQFWMNLQSQYDLRCAERGLVKELKKIKPVARKVMA